LFGQSLFQVKAQCQAQYQAQKMLVQLQLYLMLLLQSIPEVLLILPSFEWQEFEELFVQFKGLFGLLAPLFLALLIPFQTKNLIMLSF